MRRSWSRIGCRSKVTGDVKATTLSLFSGLTVGCGSSVFAHFGNGFETGPFVFAELVAGALGLLVSGTLLLLGKRNQTVQCLGAFTVSFLVAMLTVPMFWPYPRSPQPEPLARIVNICGSLVRNPLTDTQFFVDLMPYL